MPRRAKFFRSTVRPAQKRQVSPVVRVPPGGLEDMQSAEDGSPHSSSPQLSPEQVRVPGCRAAPPQLPSCWPGKQMLGDMNKETSGAEEGAALAQQAGNAGLGRSHFTGTLGLMAGARVRCEEEVPSLFPNLERRVSFRWTAYTAMSLSKTAQIQQLQ